LEIRRRVKMGKLGFVAGWGGGVVRGKRASVVGRCGVEGNVGLTRKEKRASLRMMADGSESSGEEFSIPDPKTGKKFKPTLRQKEDIFVDAMYSYYAGKPLLDDDDFNALKDDLMWQGSRVVSLSRDEIKFMEAARAFAAEESIMSDEEYDALKKKLKDAGSFVALQTEPKCSLVTQTCWSDCVQDTTRQTVLYLPAAGIGALVWAFVSYEYTPLKYTNPLLSLVVGIPFIVVFARLCTGLVLPNPLILTGKCPSCGSDTRVYFGDIATVPGFKDVAELKCGACSAKLTLDRNQRRFRLNEN